LNVYAETNFVLELTLVQEQHAGCEEILALGEAGRVRLVIPSYSLVEPYETLRRRHKERTQLRINLERELLLPRFDDGCRYVRHVLSSHAS